MRQSLQDLGLSRLQEEVITWQDMETTGASCLFSPAGKLFRQNSRVCLAAENRQRTVQRFSWQIKIRLTDSKIGSLQRENLAGDARMS
jgi:hypothetical protein